MAAVLSATRGRAWSFVVMRGCAPSRRNLLARVGLVRGRSLVVATRHLTENCIQTPKMAALACSHGTGRTSSNHSPYD